MMEAKEEYRNLQKPSTQMGVEIRSIAHGAVYPNHHRHQRTLHLFISECALADPQSDCVVLKIGENNECTTHLYQKEGRAEAEPFVVASQ